MNQAKLNPPQRMTQIAKSVVSHMSIADAGGVRTGPHTVNFT